MSCEDVAKLQCIGTTVTTRSNIHDENNKRLNLLVFSL